MARITMTFVDNRPKIIYSRNNQQIRQIRNLHLREERERSGLYFIEGVRFVAHAVQHNVRLETLVVAPELMTNVFAQRTVRQQRRAGVPVLEVPKEVFHSLSLSDEPQGIAAVVRQRWTPLENVTPSGELCWVALDAVMSPGNLGTVLRTCDAVGAAGVVLLGDSTDPYDPATVRASMGALFSQRFARATVEEFGVWKRRHGCFVVGTSPYAEQEYRALAYRRPTVLFMGCERSGLSAACQAQCDVMVRIPMVGTMDSLNLGIATSVLLYELFHQRQDARGTPGQK
jgi:RNA methyltransferase, TrmH family